MSDQRFKTMRHIETVRNYLGAVIRALTIRQEQHDQTKLESPEREIFDEYTPKLRGCTYGSDEYKQYLVEMNKALKHHYEKNAHHPEHFQEEADATFRASPIRCMNLIDLLEMLCDWKAATLRHADGDIYKSIEINQKRFGYSDELKSILRNTVDWLNQANVYHKADES